MLTAPDLTKRGEKGSPLTTPEGDQNWQDIEDFLNAVSVAISTSINDNGTLKLYNRDVGTQDSFAIVPADYLSAYVNGIGYVIRAANSNTGDATLSVANGVGTFLAPKKLLRNGASLVSGDISSGTVFAAFYDSTDDAFNVITSGATQQITNGGGGDASTPTGSSTIQTYQPPDSALVTTNNTVTLAHGFNSAPSGVDIGLVCLTAENDFTVGQVVPITDFFNGDTPNHPAFVIQSNATNILITQNITQPKVIRPSTGGVVSLTAANWKIRVIAYIFSSDNKFTPALQDLPGIHATITPLPHGLAGTPTTIVGLFCNAPELGFAVGDFVPISQFFDVNADPAFTVVVDATNIAVTQNVATPKVMRSDNNWTAQPITPANWQIKIFAFLANVESTLIPSSNEFSIANPDGAIGVGNAIIIGNYGRHSGKLYLSKLDLTNNDVTLLQTRAAPAGQLCNMSMFRIADGTDQIVWTTNKGIFTMPFSGASIAQYGTANTSNFKPVWVNQSIAPGTNSNPEFYLVASSYVVQAGYTTTSLLMNKVSFLSGAYAAPVAVGTNLVLTDNRIGNYTKFSDYHSNTAEILLFQYNPVNKRIYVVTTECGYMFIFNIKAYTASANISDWWKQADGTRYPQLAVEKIIALPGGGGLWAQAAREHIAVEFDLTTGQEKSICYTRVNNASVTGSVSRIGWRE